MEDQQNSNYNEEEKDEELNIDIPQYPVGVIPLKFRPCNTEIHQKIQEQVKKYQDQQEQFQQQYEKKVNQLKQKLDPNNTLNTSFKQTLPNKSILKNISLDKSILNTTMPNADISMPEKPDIKMPEKPDISMPEKHDISMPGKPNISMPENPDMSVDKPNLSAKVPEKPKFANPLEEQIAAIPKPPNLSYKELVKKVQQNLNKSAGSKQFFGKNKKDEEKICSCDTISAPGIYKLKFSVQVPPKPRNPKEQTPVLYVGIVQDGREDTDNYGENWAFKRLFGANTKSPDNRGMMGNIDGSWEYNYDIEQDLQSGKENDFELIMDFDKNLFRIKTPNKKNKYQNIKNFVNLNKCEWRIYFSWFSSSAKITIKDFERQNSKIKIKDKYGRVIVPEQQKKEE